MNSWPGKLLAVLVAALLVTASGPAVAYASSQALPELEVPDDFGDDQTVSASDVSKIGYSPPAGFNSPSPSSPGTDSEGNNGQAKDPDRGKGREGDKGKDNNGNGGHDKDGDRGRDSDKGNDKDRGNDDPEGGDRGKPDDPGRDNEKGENGNNGQGEGKNGNNGNGNDNGGDGPPGQDTDDGDDATGDGKKDWCGASGNSNGVDRGNGRKKGHNERDGAECRDGVQSLTIEDGDITLEPNASALAHRRAAVTLLRAATVSGPGNSAGSFDRKRQRYLELLNGTYTYVLDEDRVTSVATFRIDHRVGASFHKKTPNVTRHLVASDRKLADQAMTDAERVRDELDDRNISYNESAVDEQLAEARQAYQQGEGQRTQSQHASVEHYRRGWTHAQRAIDIMDEAVVPNVTIDRKRNASREDIAENPLALDFPRDNVTTLTVSGTVFDVRGYELAGTIRVNNGTRNLSLTSGTAPLSTVSFNRTIELERQLPKFQDGNLTDDGTLRTYEVNVSVRDPGIDLADQGYDEEDQRDLHHPQLGGDALFFDGDGLPGWYEREFTRTDPLDPDSDVAATDRDESGDRIIDGAEDPDDDTLNNYREFFEGTDPLDSDTDRDNLTDSFELQWQYDPLEPDSDDDGIRDSREDPDDDGLVNVDEQQHDTSPRRNDSDKDGIEDGREVVEIGTDPTLLDTDEDHLGDGTELDLPTAPKDPDSDDDGVLDGNDLYTTTARSGSLGVTVHVTAQGNAADDVNIGRPQGSGFDSSHITSISASPVVQIDSERPFESVSVIIEYDENEIATNESDLAAFRYDRERKQFVKLPTTVHRVNNTVTTRPEKLGTFVVMSISGLDDQAPDEDDQPEPSVDKDTFEVDLTDCSGFCESDGDGITIGVTSAGKGEYPGQTSATVGSSSTTGTGVTRLGSTTRIVDGAELADTSGPTGDPLVEVEGATLNRSGTGSSVVYWTNETISSGSSDAGGAVGVQSIASLGQDDGTAVNTLATIDSSRATDVHLEFDVSGTAKFGASYKLIANGEHGNRTLFTVACSDDDCVKKKDDSISKDVGGIAGDEVKLQVVGGGTGGIILSNLRVELVLDRDGDGLPDGDDLCTDTGHRSENGCPDSTYDAARLTFDRDVDTIQIKVSGESYVERHGSSTKLEVVTASGESTELFSDSSKGHTDIEYSGTETVIENVGSDVTLRLEASGTAALHLSALEMRIDTDGDGFWDRQELDGIPVSRYDDVTLDPYLADTDSDGLRDDEEVGGRNDRGFYWVNSWPRDPDSDDDGVGDGDEENVWRSENTDPDTDGDDYNDQVDPLPNTESAVPEVEFVTANSEELIVDVSDESAIEKVEVTAVYTDRTSLATNSVPSLEIRTFEPDDVQHVDGRVRYTVSIDADVGLLGRGPDSYQLNVTDANGNTVSHYIIPDIGDGRSDHVGAGMHVATAGETHGAMVLQSGAASTPATHASGASVSQSAGSVAVRAGPALAPLLELLGASALVVLAKIAVLAAIVVVAIAAVVAVVAPELVYTQFRTPRSPQSLGQIGKGSIQGGTYANVPPAGEVVATSTIAGSTVTLREGVTFSRDGSVRGYGLEYITATTSLTLAAVEHAINNPRRTITNNGDVEVVIGRSLTEKGSVIISVIGGTISAASHEQGGGKGDYEEDYCERDVYVPGEDSHPYKDGVTRKDVIDALKIPHNGKIWQVTDGFYYIGQASNGVWFLVHVVQGKHPEHALYVSTLLTELRGNWNGGSGGEEFLENEKDATEHDC